MSIFPQLPDCLLCALRYHKMLVPQCSINIKKYCFPAHSLYVLSLFSSRSFCHKGYFMPQKQNVSTTKKPPATAHPPVHHSQTTFFYHYIVIFITVRKDKNIPSDFRLLHGLLLFLHGLPIQPGTVHDAYLLL